MRNGVEIRKTEVGVYKIERGADGEYEVSLDGALRACGQTLRGAREFVSGDVRRALAAMGRKAWARKEILEILPLPDVRELGMEALALAADGARRQAFEAMCSGELQRAKGDPEVPDPLEVAQVLLRLGLDALYDKRQQAR